MKISKLIIAVVGLAFYTSDTTNVKFAVYTGAKVVQDASGSKGSNRGDIDCDGLMDLIITNWGDNSNNKLFFNLSDNKNRNWIKVDLKGKRSASTPYGARVSVYYLGIGELKVFHHYLQSQPGYASQSTHQLHFDLGNSEKIDSLIINWPSGVKQKIINPKSNTKHMVIEQT